MNPRTLQRAFTTGKVHIGRLLGALLLAWTGGSAALDEAAVAEQLAAEVTVGEPLVLQAGETSVFALLTEETSGDRQGGAILLHDRETHPDWREVIGPLREALPDAGWTTLSVQMPLNPGADAEQWSTMLEEARPRIDAAVARLAAEGIGNVVLIGHGTGALIAANYLNGYQGGAIRGLVAIGIVGFPDPRLDAATQLAGVRQPILDIFGGRDLFPVNDSARSRAERVRKAIIERGADTPVRPALARALGSRAPARVTYRQMQISGADHGFSGRETTLVRRVRGWLKRHATDL